MSTNFYNRQPPPFGPGGFGFGPGGPGGPGGPPSGGMPPGPPPSVTPQQPLTAAGPSVYAVDPGAVRPCVYRFVYIWLNNGRQFWAWLTFVGRRSAAGWRWNGRRWVYFAVDLRNIDYFECY